MALIKLSWNSLSQSSFKSYLYNCIVFMKLFSEAIYRVELSHYWDSVRELHTRMPGKWDSTCFWRKFLKINAVWSMEIHVILFLILVIVTLNSYLKILITGSVTCLLATAFLWKVYYLNHHFMQSVTSKELKW